MFAKTVQVWHIREVLVSWKGKTFSEFVAFGLTFETSAGSGSSWDPQTSHTTIARSK